MKVQIKPVTCENDKREEDVSLEMQSNGSHKLNLIKFADN